MSDPLVPTWKGMHGEAYRHLTWAIDMLEAVDQEFRVSERRAFDECGSAFRPSIKRAVWQCADASHRDLRRVSQSCTLFKGAFPLIKEVEMAQKIIRSGETRPPATDALAASHSARTCAVAEFPPHEFGLPGLQNEVAFRRKPLTYAHGALASLLGQLRGELGATQGGAELRRIRQLLRQASAESTQRTRNTMIVGCNLFCPPGFQVAPN